VKSRKRSSGLLGRVNAAGAAVGRSGASRKTRLGTLGGPAQACSGFRGDLQGPNPVEKGHPKGLRGSQGCAGRQRRRAPYHDLKRHRAVEASSSEIQNSHQPKADQHPDAARDVRGGNPLAPPLLDFETASAAGGVEAQRPGEQTTRAAARAALANDADAKKAQELHGPILARREGPAAQNPAMTTGSAWMRWRRARLASTLFEKLYWGFWPDARSWSRRFGPML
jgi:hypothetical protein